MEWARMDANGMEWNGRVANAELDVININFFE